MRQKQNKHVLFGFFLTLCNLCLLFFWITWTSLVNCPIDTAATTGRVIADQMSVLCGAKEVIRMSDLCQCSRSNRFFASYQVQSRFLTSEEPIETMSSCSDEATVRGKGQKVISYAFYGSVSSRYFNGTWFNVKDVARKYPGWIMRLYHNVNLTDERETSVLCDVWCDNDHLDLCDVRHLPYELCDKSDVFGTVWRFFVLGDPLVERFMVRDLDSVITDREVSSVNEWISRGKTWHVMRDHPYHGVVILAGMWGGMNTKYTINKNLRTAFIEKGKNWKRFVDQELLGEILWPIVKTDMLAHDSYMCETFTDSQPWPTQRHDKEFVGEAFPWSSEPFNLTECPVQCRPKDHIDWTYC